MSKRTQDLERLDAEHPEWRTMSADQIDHDFWMYFSDRVAIVRAAAHLRILGNQILGPVVKWLTNRIDRITKGTR